MSEAPESILSLLRKVKELAERGCDGERLVAQAKLAHLLKKHGMSVEDLGGDTLFGVVLEGCSYTLIMEQVFC